jgi:two-component system, LytTR family, response regulator
VRILIVDDEAPARRKVARLVAADPNLQVVGEASGAVEAIERIRAERPDLVFLDVQMPDGDGFTVLEAIADDVHVPQIIFVTAHDRFAVRAFEFCAIDYLLKPYDEERFGAALRKIRRSDAPPATDGLAPELRALVAEIAESRRYPEHFLVSGAERSVFVRARDIVRVEASRNNVMLYCGRATHVLRTTMDAIEGRLDPQRFVRLNRSAIVQIDAITELQPWFHGEYKVKLSDGTAVTWSRRYISKRPDLLRSS